MGRGSTPEPQCQFIYLFLHGCHNLYFRRNHVTVLLHQNLPQSKDVESTFVIFCFHDRRQHRRRRYLLLKLRRDIADGIIAGLFILFDVDSEPDDHSEVLLLFVGCIVNFSVSYLICMFQDSVPAGSYNDPFLSSVCVAGFCLLPGTCGDHARRTPKRVVARGSFCECVQSARPRASEVQACVCVG